MNYLDRINKFWRTHEQSPLSVSAQALYFWLLKEFNRKRWPKEMEISSTYAMMSIGLERRAFWKARAQLMTAGLIDYTEGKNRHGGSNYTLVEVQKCTATKDVEVQVEVQNCTATTLYNNKDIDDFTNVKSERETRARERVLEKFFLQEELVSSISKQWRCSERELREAMELSAIEVEASGRPLDLNHIINKARHKVTAAPEASPKVINDKATRDAEIDRLLSNYYD